MKTILALTDFSNRADHAAHYALKLAQKIKANLLLCNIFPAAAVEPVFPMAVWPTVNNESFGLDSVNEIGALANRLNRQLDNQKIKGEFRPVIEQCSKAGSLPDTINEITSNHNVAMAVISMHGADGLSNLLLEDNANEIIEKANCPVLVVPYQLPFSGFKKISFATDLKYNTTDVLQCLCGLTKYFDSEIFITHVTDQHTLDMEEYPAVKQFFDKGYSKKNYPRIYYQAIKNKSVADGLDWLSEHTDTDLLVLVHRKRSFFQRLFEGSVTKKLADHLTKPMLVFPASKIQEPLPVF